MPPRITAESCRPRVSDRTMRYHLEWITMTACQFREAEWRRYNNGDMKTHHWKAAESRNFRCDEKRPGTRTNAHGSRVFTLDTPVSLRAFSHVNVEAASYWHVNRL